MNKRKSLCITLIFLSISYTFLCIFTISSNSKDFYFNNIDKNEELDIREDKLNTADFSPKPINYTSIYRNSTDGIIRRGFESVEFKINASGYFEDNGANYTIMQVKFIDNTIKNFTMQFYDNHNFSYTYKPEVDAPLGFHIVKFYIFNKSLEDGTMILLNTQSTLTNFTIRSTSMVGFNSTEYYRGEYLLADINIDNSNNYDWEVSVVNSTDSSNQKQLLIIPDSNPFQAYFSIDEKFDLVNIPYYLVVNLSAKSGGPSIPDYFGFNVKNNNPIINMISLNPDSVFRTEICEVLLNASDIENIPANLSVSMEILDPNGESINLLEPDLENNNDGTFEGSFSIPANKIKGDYRILFTVDDLNFGSTTIEKEITIKNNLPEIDGYEINDIDTDEPISVNYGDDLKFKFDVDDIEGVAYVTIELILEDATDEDEEEFEITREYEDDLEIVIRTEDLAGGTWTVYVSVTDTDGETTELGDNFDNGPQQITVIPDLLSTYLAWITLIVGSILGIIAGLGIGFYLKKSKYPESKSEEEKVIQQKKPKTVKESITPTKPKAIEKETEKKPEKKESIEPVTKRKIKRKL